MFKSLYNFRIGVHTFNLTKVLDVKDQHVGCLYCNYGGCTYKTKGYMGHFTWTLSLLYSTLKGRTKKFIRSLSDFDLSQIDDVEVDGIDTRDYPDFCDAYIISATYKGKEMTEAQLERLNSEHPDFVYECVQERLF